MRPTAAQRLLLRTIVNQTLSLAITVLLLLPASAAALQLAHTTYLHSSTPPHISLQLGEAISAARAMSTCARSTSSRSNNYGSSSALSMKTSFWRNGGLVGIGGSGGGAVRGSKRGRNSGWAAPVAPARALRIRRRGRGLHGAGSLRWLYVDCRCRCKLYCQRMKLDPILLGELMLS